MAASITRSQLLGFRARAQQLDRGSGGLADTIVLDIGVLDTGPDGGCWHWRCAATSAAVVELGRRTAQHQAAGEEPSAACAG